MKITDNVTPFILQAIKELQALKKMKIHVGIQGSPGKNESGGGVPAATTDLLTIANVHEYGMTITPKNAKNLAIPINKDSYGKGPRDFGDLDYVPIEKGYGYLVRKRDLQRPHKGENAWKNYDWLFMLVDSVTILERSFVRSGYDNNVNRIVDVAKEQLHEIIYNGKSAKKAAEYIGGKAVDYIHEYMNKVSNFTPKGNVARGAAPTWANNPLVVTKRLFNSVSFTVEE